MYRDQPNSVKQYHRLDQLARRLTRPLLALVLGSVLAAPRSVAAQCQPLEIPSPLAAPPPHSASLSCRPDATLTRMFAPPAVAKDTYRVYVTEAPIDKVIGAFKASAQSDNVSGAWVLEETNPLSAFGEAGLYDRTKVARLYVGIPARVARGPIVRDGRTVRSITVVSPYPGPSLTRLERGTLIIEFNTSALGPRGQSAATGTSEVRRSERPKL